MKNILTTIVSILLFTTLISAGERKVLVEVLTNSHCPLCPPAHSAIDSYLQSANGNKIEFIYYHMAFPYSSDQLYQHNTSDAAAKNSFYGPHSSTPKAYFNGTLVSNSYSNWGTSLNGLTAEESDIEISLSGNFTENDFTITADVSQTGDIGTSDLTINYVVVENLTYAGNNGINNHKNVMRKIVNPQGDQFAINLNETKSLSTTITKNENWETDNLKVIVFAQNKTNKQVLQSESISYSELILTGVEDKFIITDKFNLEQNYPNPFNPTTTISYSIPNVKTLEASTVELIVYDVLGKEVITLVNKQQSSGTYQIVFDASKLSSGFYYYQLKAGNTIETKKMILLK
jgi:Outer membrane protein Omp28/Secretion system C-terminal sorting domain